MRADVFQASRNLNRPGGRFSGVPPIDDLRRTHCERETQGRANENTDGRRHFNREKDQNGKIDGKKKTLESDMD